MARKTGNGTSWGRLRMELVRLYVDPEDRTLWEKKARETGKGRKNGTKPNLSDFIRSAVNLHIKGGGGKESASGMNAAQLEAQISNLKLEVDRLLQENSELKKREVGVSDERVLTHLSEDKAKSFQEVLDELLATEADALWAALRKHVQSGKVEWIHPHNQFRLRPGGRRR